MRSIILHTLVAALLMVTTMGNTVFAQTGSDPFAPRPTGGVGGSYEPLGPLSDADRALVEQAQRNADALKGSSCGAAISKELTQEELREIRSLEAANRGFKNNPDNPVVKANKKIIEDIKAGKYHKPCPPSAVGGAVKQGEKVAARKAELVAEKCVGKTAGKTFAKKIRFGGIAGMIAMVLGMSFLQHLLEGKTVAAATAEAKKDLTEAAKDPGSYLPPGPSVAFGVGKMIGASIKEGQNQPAAPSSCSANAEVGQRLRDLKDQDPQLYQEFWARIYESLRGNNGYLGAVSFMFKDKNGEYTSLNPCQSNGCAGSCKVQEAKNVGIKKGTAFTPEGIASDTIVSAPLSKTGDLYPSIIYCGCAN